MYFVNVSFAKKKTKQKTDMKRIAVLHVVQIDRFFALLNSYIKHNHCNVGKKVAINRNDETMFKARHRHLGDEIGEVHQGHAPVVPGFLVNFLLLVQFEFSLCDNGTFVCGALL